MSRQRQSGSWSDSAFKAGASRSSCTYIYISTCIGDLFCSAYPYPSIRQSPAPQKTLVAAQQACGILALMIVMMLTIALVGKAQAAEVPTTVHMTSANAF